MTPTTIALLPMASAALTLAVVVVPALRAPSARLLTAAAGEQADTGTAATSHGRSVGWTRWPRRRRPTQATDLEGHLPDLVALIELAVGAGLSATAAIEAVTPAAPRPLRCDLDRVSKAVGAGVPAADALASLVPRWGDGGSGLLHALDDHLRDGVPLLPRLATVGTEARAQRWRSAQARARRLPVLLLFPLVLCVLPAFGLLTVAPMVASTLGALDVRPLEAQPSPTP